MTPPSVDIDAYLEELRDERERAEQYPAIEYTTDADGDLIMQCEPVAS